MVYYSINVMIQKLKYNIVSCYIDLNMNLGLTAQ